MKQCQNCGLNTKAFYKLSAKNFRRNSIGKLEGNLTVCKKCQFYFKGRDAATKKILNSNAQKRVIVAGPGTGKTYTFKQVVESMSPDRKVLIFTLINNLARELDHDFGDEFGNVTTGTFHGYCKNLLYNDLGFQGHYYPGIPIIIERDSRFLDMEFTKKSFHKAFANLEEDSPEIDFFMSRSNYYKTIGHDSSVYRVYKYFENHKDNIPSYDLVIADEYQDFNKMEVSFINLLTRDVPVLVAGDDEQALYGFREASTHYIRDIYHHDSDYENLTLPFSSRCTHVLVKTVNHLIEEAENKGLLKGRIEDKEFISYWPEKYMFDKKYPEIELARCTTPETANTYIRTKIENLTKNEELTGEEKDIQFMIIGAESQHRLDSLAEYLNANLDQEMYEIQTKEAKEPIVEEQGLRYIYKDPDSNLGWRIILHTNPLEDIEKIIKLSYEKELPIVELLPEDYKRNYLKNAEEYFSQENEQLDIESQDDGNKIQVKLTNCLGSKGLSALHVIVTEFHNGVIPSDKAGQAIVDEDIYRCIVSLTRAKRSCSLVTFKEFDPVIGKLVYRPSKLIEMLPKQGIKEIWCRIKNGDLVCSN